MSRRKSCLVCNSDNLDQILDFGLQPFADTFVPKDLLAETEPIFPLKLDLCQECGHVQTQIATNPEDRYAKYEYSFISSSSALARSHWQQYALDITKCKPPIIDSFVLEIGSNDGYLGECLMNHNYTYLGIDASPVMVNLANNKGIKSWYGLFNGQLVDRIINEIAQADVIIANNVFNHIDNLEDFMVSISKVMKKDGYFIFEVPYWLQEFEQMNFGKVYHEHVSYFTIRSVKRLLSKYDLVINNIELNDYHGGTMRVSVGRDNECTEKIKQFELKEIQSNVFDNLAYSRIYNELLDKRIKTLELLSSYKVDGIPIIGIGAAAKGNSFLNFHNLDYKMIDCITDVSPSKIGKYTPMSRIPIKTDDEFEKYTDVVGLILTENLSEKIKEILLSKNPKIKFINSIQE
jgi:SAM-dependent methyltransferase